MQQEGFGVQKAWQFLLTSNHLCRCQFECPVTQFSPDPVYPEAVSESTGGGLMEPREMLYLPLSRYDTGCSMDVIIHPCLEQPQVPTRMPYGAEEASLSLDISEF